MTNFLLIVLAVAGAAWLFARCFLDGADLARHDGPTGQRFASTRPASPGIPAAMARLDATNAAAQAAPRRQRLAVKRHGFDRMFDDLPIDAALLPADAGGVPGEWVLAPGADPQRRMLYLHGGGLVVGSARSHRTITARMSALCGGAVLAIDYRLLPEHRRIDSVLDCRNAWCWMLDHGPYGAAPAGAVFVAGDSAGANLTLALLPWLRDRGLRQPAAAVALSPATDGTFGSPSLRTNAASDPMLGAAALQVLRVPRTLLLYLAWFKYRIRPCDPVVSPVYGDLAGLPPVLIQASETEILYDDARRYANRAQQAGSPVTLQSWNHTLHVWHIFAGQLPEAEEAFAQIGAFLAAATIEHEART